MRRYMARRRSWQADLRLRTFQMDVDTASEGEAQRLPGVSAQLHGDRVLRQTVLAERLGYLVAQHRTHGAVQIAENKEK